MIYINYNNNILIIVISCLSDKKSERLIKNRYQLNAILLTQTNWVQKRYCKITLTTQKIERLKTFLVKQNQHITKDSSEYLNHQRCVSKPIK